MTDDPNESIGTRLVDTPIAIVGLGALYPRAEDLTRYWSNIVAGLNCIEDVPQTHWRIDDYYDPDPTVPDKTYVKQGGFIPTVPFDPVEFGLPPNTLEVTDVLQLLSLVVAKHTLADAGAPGSDWYDKSRTGVVLGITGANSLTQPLATRLQTPVLREVVRSCGLTDRDADEIAEKFVAAFAPWEENSFPGMLGNVVAGRIANRFDLGGMNCTVDAACASSLAAVRMAVSELVSGRADLMLSGGCDAENTILMYLCFSKTPALSKSGRIRPFDEGSDGTMIGEGMGMLALKRLADAERDGDSIYAVLRGIGSSSDGRYKSIYAPRREGQEVALRRAYRDADLRPSEIGLLECHGTGTPVGDLTELTALREVFGESGANPQSCAVGSVKSQIGHTKASAGAAGLIKLALALRHKVLPPTIGVEQPKKAVDFPTSPFYINSRTRPWVDDGRARRAAISSFGFGGTNFHCILEEYTAGGDPATVLHDTWQVIGWQAADPEALVAEVGEHPGGGNIDDISPGNARLIVVARDPESLERVRSGALSWLQRDPSAAAFDMPIGAWYRRRAEVPGKIAALFAGQGSQYVDMGAAAALAVPTIRAEFDAAAGWSDPEQPLAAAIFPPPAFDEQSAAANEETLRRTEYAQPAIGALSAGQYRFLRELGFRPDAVLGHSFGELTALWAAGVFSDRDFHRLAAARGRVMASRPSGQQDAGTMAALRCAEATLRELLAAHPRVVVCNDNGPDQVVVGGPSADVEAVVALAQSRSIKARLLPVSAAFHTELVAHAVDAFAAALAPTSMAAPQVEVLANTAGAVYGSDSAANRAVLARQLTQPVAFAERVRQLYADGFRVFVEFGPGTVLASLVRRILDDSTVVVLSTDAGSGQDGDRALKQAAAQLLALGVPLAQINRSARPPAPQTARKGMQVALNGVNYVSPGRRAAYREAIDNGYRVSTVQTESGSTVQSASGPTVQSESETTARPPADSAAHSVTASTEGGSPVPDSAHVDVAFTSGEAHRTTRNSEGKGVPRMTDGTQTPTGPAPGGHAETRSAAEEHLGLHQAYLNGQMRLAERLSDILEAGVRSGGPSQETVRALVAVSEHSVAIGRAHAHAGEVLLGFARLEAGIDAGGESSRAYDSFVTRESVAARIDEPAAPQSAVAAAPSPGSTEIPQRQVAAAPAPPVTTPAQPTATAPAQPTATAPARPTAPSPESAARSTAPAQSNPAPRQATAPAAQPATPAAVQSVAAEPVSAPEPSPAAATASAPEPVTAAASAADGTAEVIRAALLDVVSDSTGYPPDMLEMDMSIEADLGIDSIKRVEILGALQERFPDSPSAGPEAMGELDTLGSIVDFIGGSLASVGSGEAVVRPKADGASGILRMQTRLQHLPPVDAIVGAEPSSPSRLFAPGAVVVLGAGATADHLADLLTEARFPVRRNLPDGEDLAAVLFVGDVPEGTAAATARLRDVLLLAGETVQRLRSAAASGRAAFLVVGRSDGSLGYGVGRDRAAAIANGTSGVIKTLAIEAPEIFGRAIDIAVDMPPSTAAAAIMRELVDSDVALTEVGISPSGTRITIRATYDRPAPAGTIAEPGPADVLVVTGGARGITADCAIGLATRYRCELVLVGRSSAGEEPDWARGVPVDGLRAAIIAHLRKSGAKPTPREVESRRRQIVAAREIAGTLEAIRAAGSTGHYIAVDITDTAAVASALAPWRSRVTGLVHGAGVLADRAIVDLRAEDIDPVVHTKIDGLLGVLAALDPTRLRRMVVFSSIAGFYGNHGQAAYAAANEALNRLSHAVGAHLAGRATAINWGAWSGGMVTAELAAMFAERGVTLIPIDVGVGHLVESFASDAPSGVVLVGPDMPLSVGPAPNPMTGAPTIRRDLRPLLTTALLSDHRLGGVPIVPTAAVIGMLAVLGERVIGAPVRRVDGMAVLKGVVVDADVPAQLNVDFTPIGDSIERAAAVMVRDDQGRSRYRGAVSAGVASIDPAPGMDIPDIGAGSDVYSDGTLFHGPSLRGIVGHARTGAGGWRARCRRPSDAPAPAGYATALFDPVIADLLLQATLVAARMVFGAACLPSAIGSVEMLGPPTPELVIDVDGLDEAGPITRCSVIARSLDGTAILAMRDVQLTCSPSLADKFAAGASVREVHQ